MKVEFDPRKTAFLIIDMQNDWINKEGALAKLGSSLWKIVEAKQLVKNINKALETARKHKVSVFHVRAVFRKDLRDFVETLSDVSLKTRERIGKSYKEIMKETPWGVEGTWGADFVKELQPQDEEFVITKRRGSAFYNTDLELYLNSIGANMLVVTGIATDACVDATVQDAKNRDLNVVILTDCVAADNEKVQDFWLENVFPQSTITMTSEELIEALQKPET